MRALADIMWTINEPEDVLVFINSLPKAQRDEAHTVMGMMIWAMLDTVMETNLAEIALRKYML